jgi:hypothetical protein
MLACRWSRNRFSYDDDEAMERALKEKLDACKAANITVIAGAGPCKRASWALLRGTASGAGPS